MEIEDVQVVAPYGVRVDISYNEVEGAFREAGNFLSLHLDIDYTSTNQLKSIKL